jgi:hypothetical protein
MVPIRFSQNVGNRGESANFDEISKRYASPEDGCPQGRDGESRDAGPGAVG